MRVIFLGFIDHVYDRTKKTLEGVTEEELSWLPSPTANTAGRILRHVARISSVLLPQVVEGTTRGDWDDGYENDEHTLPEMLADLEAGRVKVLKRLGSFSEADWETTIPLWGGVHPRKEGVYMLVSELAHHEGQIAYIRGAYRRAHMATDK